MDLRKLLKEHINTTIHNEDNKSQIGALSGSNALLFDGVDFEAESSDHCPRIALLRRVADIQTKRESKSFISNTHGRLFETFFKNLIQNKFKLEFKEEEEAEVLIEDDAGNTLLTARPDILFKDVDEDKIYPVECKTIQSSSTAYNIYIKEKPKLGAAIQLAIYMYGHNTEDGFLLYSATTWFSGFVGKTQWKVEPSLKIFDCKLTDGTLYYNDKKSVVTIEKLIKGSYEFLSSKQQNLLPKKPHWIDINGDLAKYDGCSLCPFNSVCERFDASNNTNLKEFFNGCKDIIR